MAFFTPDQIDALTALDRSNMPDTCDIWTSASPRVRVGQDVPCRVKAETVPGLGDYPDRPQVVAAWEIALPAGTDVKPDWQIRMSAATYTPGLRDRIFTVSGDADGSWETSRRVHASEGQ